MPELAVINTNGFQITTCDRFEETENNLILFNSENKQKGWVHQSNVKRILPVEEEEDDEE